MKKGGTDSDQVTTVFPEGFNFSNATLKFNMPS